MRRNPNAKKGSSAKIQKLDNSQDATSSGNQSKPKEKERNVWFRVVGANGAPYQGSNAVSISLSPSTLINDFLQIVSPDINAMNNKVVRAHLTVYANQVSFPNAPLNDENDIIGDHGTQKINPILVAVPVGDVWFKYNGEATSVTFDCETIVSEVKEEVADSFNELNGRARELVFTYENTVLENDASIVSLGVIGSSKDNAIEVSIPALFEWKNVKDFTYSVEDGALFFVNRTDAVKQLQENHFSKYCRACLGSGADWSIPIADNVFGLGKSDFGSHYIKKCNEQMYCGSEEFHQHLRSCHTVKVLLSRSALFLDSGDEMNQAMIRLLKNSLRPLFIKEPPVFSQVYLKSDDFLRELTSVVGPLFIHLDEIESAFVSDNVSEFESRDKFFTFCNNVIGSWLLLKDVFFLLTGRASFFSYVGRRPTETQTTSSPFKFERLKLQLIRPTSIMNIMKFTTKNGKTLKDFYEITSDEELQQVASTIFRKTNGHPRSILSAFQSCINLQKLLEYEQPLELNWSEFYTLLMRNMNHMKPLLDALCNDTAVDLTRLVKERDDKGNLKFTTLDIIAYQSFIAWEGEITNAKLFCPPELSSFFRNYFMPLQEYLKEIAKTAETVSPDYPNVFEWLLLKRFQEMFSTSKTPKMAILEFFDTPLFGNCRFALGKDVVPMPKITNKGTRNPADISLTSKTAHPDIWGHLLSEIESYDSINLKPAPMSSSPDALLSFIDCENRRVTVGIAAKNFNVTPLSKAILTKESVIFDRIFKNCLACPRLNVLVVCATKFNQEITDLFNGKKSFLFEENECEFVDEIIVLDLSSIENMSLFFGLAEQDILVQIIMNVVAKHQVEYVSE